MLYNNHSLTSIICLHTVCSNWPIDRNLTGATTPGRVDLGTMAMKESPQISKAKTSPSDGLMPYPGHSLSYTSPKM